MDGEKQSLEGQQSFFKEFDSLYQENHVEPDIEEIVPSLEKKKHTGKRDEDLKDLPVTIDLHKKY